jgi:hypothetical protein
MDCLTLARQRMTRMLSCCTAHYGFMNHIMERDTRNHPKTRLLKNYLNSTICRHKANLIDYRLCTQGTFSAVSRTIENASKRFARRSDDEQ